MNKQYSSLAFMTLVSLVLVGAGCSGATHEAADTVLDGAVRTPLGALDQAQRLSAAEQARQNREAALTGNLLPVALILTQGSEAPAEAEIGVTIGCADQVAMIGMSRLSATDRPVIDALQTLLGWNDSSYQGLYNALHFSTLTVDKVTTHDGRHTEVWLSGEVDTGGNCDNPRVKAQVEETVRQFHPDYKILLNGDEANWRCLGDSSGQCE